MQIEYDPAKRDDTLLRRGLDMADAAHVFRGETLTVPDQRLDYGEDRFLTVGFLAGRMVIIAWTPRADAYRIISMRKANDREIARFAPRFRNRAG